MNCQSFQVIVNELARDQMMDATVRNEAIQHSKDCESCLATLEAELKLTSSLRALAGEVRRIAPSPALQHNLMREFRVHQRQRPLLSRGRARARIFVAVAAVLFLVVGLGIVRSLLNVTPTHPPAITTNVGPVPAKPVPADSNATPGMSPDGPSQPTPPPRKPVRRPSTKRHINPTTVTPALATLSASNREAEVATQFYPVGYSSALSVQDGGQLIRVELPRSAMTAFGLPVNMDRYNERVKADVLMGADGLARAIRFVQ
jgi:hypothetical protein